MNEIHLLARKKNLFFDHLSNNDSPDKNNLSLPSISFEKLYSLRRPWSHNPRPKLWFFMTMQEKINIIK